MSGNPGPADGAGAWPLSTSDGGGGPVASIVRFVRLDSWEADLSPLKSPETYELYDRAADPLATPPSPQVPILHLIVLGVPWRYRRIDGVPSLTSAAS